MFNLREVVNAVHGKLLSGSPELSIGGVSIDSRTIKKGELFIAIKGGRFNGHDFLRQAVRKGARAVIFSCEFPLKPKEITSGNDTGFIAVEDTRKALGELACFYRKKFNVPVIAVTGSNGKTTTKDMLAWVLSSRLKVLKNTGTENNDIGVPLTLFKLDISYDIVVLELGTNRFGEIDYLANIARPNAGIITNIGTAHLENLKNLNGVCKEKTALLKNLNPPGIAILNADDHRLRKFKSDNKIFCVTYGIKNKSDFYAKKIKVKPNKTIEFFVNLRGLGKNPKPMQLRTPGYFNIYNALAVIALARIWGWDYRTVIRRLGTFVFPPGRLRPVKYKGISFIDDTYNANPVSIREALDALGKIKVKGRRIFIMGDMLELGESAEKLHRQIGNQIARICDVFIGVGKLTRLTAHQAFESGLGKDCIFNCKDSLHARDLLFRVLKPNCQDSILVKGSRLMKMEEVFKK
ncbi:MAG: UDP-N-acetylmuramoyl-tripeptide--D-alanyl-D-alanine ligase [Candidatus Omnitrophota bacterium]